MLVNCNMMKRDCDWCRSVKATVFCHADAAMLCESCDADVHSANLISHSHRRVPVGEVVNQDIEEDDGDGSGCNYEDLFGDHEVDEYLDLEEFDEKVGLTLSVKDEVIEGVVPVVQPGAAFGYPASMRHGLSLSSMEANSIVPDTTAMADISSSHIRAYKGTIDLFSGPPIQIPTQLSQVDREARVLRYREKKKTRNFEKTIRYASRKAYAEARPRIKGRFARRSEVDMEVDQMFSNYVVNEDGYGVVPSF